MAIYNIFDYTEKASSNGSSDERKPFERTHLDEAKLGFHEEKGSLRDRLLSSLGARFFFFLLLLADICWGVYVVLGLTLFFVLSLVTFFKISTFRMCLAKFFLSLKRFLVGALALVVALVSPALGIMFACTYFLMYDKAGIDEVVPSFLRDQFKDFFSHAM
jgi:hypothetical protein